MYFFDTRKNHENFQKILYGGCGGRSAKFFRFFDVLKSFDVVDFFVEKFQLIFKTRIFQENQVILQAKVFKKGSLHRIVPRFSNYPRRVVAMRSFVFATLLLP